MVQRAPLCEKSLCAHYTRKEANPHDERERPEANDPRELSTLTSFALTRDVVDGILAVLEELKFIFI
jgi:hypothetical protein